MEYRELGSTGEKLSIVGFGGILAARETQDIANRYVDEALDAGVNYFDTAPTYFDAEDRMGPAISRKRNRIFLACKTENRNKDGARALLEQSLKKLGTDHFDLYQFHAVTTMADVETIFGTNGAMETFQKAREEGMIRHIGFSAHNEEAAHAMMDRFQFDSVLYPINWMNLLNKTFSTSVIETANSKGMGVLALKGMAFGKWLSAAPNPHEKMWYEPISDEQHAKLAYRWTLSQNISAAIPPGYMQWFRWALDVANTWKPITTDEINKLRDLATGVVPLFPI